jgi:hypothetical protein
VNDAAGVFLGTETRFIKLESLLAEGFERQDLRIGKQENWRMWLMGGLAVVAFEATIVGAFAAAILLKLIP